MAWKINFDDKSVLLDDLTEDVFVEATKQFDDTTWLRLYMSPCSHPGAYYELLKLCARRLEVDEPPRPKNIKESIALMVHVEAVDDDLPAAFDEAGLPLGTGEADETEMTTSSTSTAPEDGLPNELVTHP